MRESRSINCDVRAAEGGKSGHYLIGIPIVFNKRTNLGDYDEIIEDGALNGTDLHDVRFLINHDRDGLPLARYRSTSRDNTMQIRVIPKKGLEIMVDLDIENSATAKELYSSVKRGDVSGMSFAFQVGSDNWEGLETDHPLRRILQISRVWEVSAVTFPAYEATSIQARDSAAPDKNSKAYQDELLKRKIKILSML